MGLLDRDAVKKVIVINSYRSADAQIRLEAYSHADESSLRRIMEE
jgi:hypothetical protein